MWRTACKRLDHSVHPVLLRTPKTSTLPELWQTIGTAFAINHKYNPTFITNAHVILDADGNQISDDDLAIYALTPEGGVAGFSPMIVAKELDIAVCEASKEAAVAVPVTFASTEPAAVGTAVASLGFPIPDAPEITPKGSHLYVSERLATGFISSTSRPAKMPEWPWSDGLPHYEVNMFLYPGISGGPVFDQAGRVLGVNRGGRLHEKHVTAYGITVRNAELLPFLDQHHVEYMSEEALPHNTIKKDPAKST